MSVHRSGESERIAIDGRNALSNVGCRVEQREAGEVEAGRNAATDERVLAERACGLPDTCGNADEWPRVCRRIGTTEPMAFKPIRGGIEQHQFDRIAFVMLPDFVGVDAMPSADFAGTKQIVDGGDRWSRRAVV